MKITKSVAKAISEWQAGDLESAMLHACNAVSGTAKIAYKSIESDREKFTRLLRDNYAILGPMAMPGVDLDKTLFGIDLHKVTPKITELDLADLIYKIHRCTHGHGDELPNGFELISNAGGPAGITEHVINFAEGTVSLSDRVIFGMLAVVVFAPVNAHQKSDYGYFLSYGEGPELLINEWWGRADDFMKIIDGGPRPVIVINQYGDGDMPARTSGVIHFKMPGRA